MFQKDFGGLQLWQFHNLSSIRGLTHYVSGKKGGCSTGDKEGLNLSFLVGDNKESVACNRKILADALGVPATRLIFPVQTHSCNVGVVGREDDIFENTDALITNTPGLCISVMSADCVPVLLADPVKRVIGAVHAGWKGTVGKVASNTVRAMAERYGSRPSDIVAAIGPSISPKVYEVGEEVIAAVVQAFGSKEGLVERVTEDGKGYLNLWEANRRQLTEAGVREENIEVAGICTYENPEDFFSARRSANKAGRFAAGILLT